jgi:hypothetical protein
MVAASEKRVAGKGKKRAEEGNCALVTFSAIAQEQHESQQCIQRLRGSVGQSPAEEMIKRTKKEKEAGGGSGREIEETRKKKKFSADKERKPFLHESIRGASWVEERKKKEKRKRA